VEIASLGKCSGVKYMAFTCLDEKYKFPCAYHTVRISEGINAFLLDADDWLGPLSAVLVLGKVEYLY
jgi:hypothetical protein